jgi:TPR repeat protein
MCDEDIFADAFGAFFALEVAPVCADPALCARDSAYTREAYMNTIGEYRRAAEAGNRPAQEMLGLMYLYGSQLYGEGVDRDVREATHWLELAAAQDSVLARQLLRRYVLSQPGQNHEIPISAVTDYGTSRMGAGAQQ